MTQEAEHVEFLREQRIVELPAHVGDFGNEDHNQQYMGDVELPAPFQEPPSGDDRPPLQHGGAVDEAGRIAGNEHEHFGGVAETVVPKCDPADEVEGNVVEKNYPEPESAEQIEPQVTSGKRGRKHSDLLRLDEDQ